MEDFSFPKSQRLSGKKDIELLFSKGTSLSSFPFRILRLPSKENKVLFSVPYRNFKKATDRNRIKRIMREAWRLNQHRIGPAKPMLIAYIYQSREILPFQTIAEKMIHSFRYLSDTNEKN